MSTPNIQPSVLVITATITPPKGMPGSIRNDPQLRLEEYCRALSFYLQIPTQYIDRILFLENSGHALRELNQVAASINHDKKLEFISFVGDYAPYLGKATGEFQMLDYGLTKCSFLSAADVLWKMTGRLRVLNLAQLIQTVPKNYSLYCDMRDVPFIGDQLGGNQWCDMRLFSCTVEAYNRLLRGRGSDLALTYGNPEKTLFKHIRQAMRTDHTIVPRFQIQPQVEGISGYGNADYQSLSYRLKGTIRQLSRQLLPWLWL